MNFVSSPVKSLSGDIEVPGDKSISHRAILLGSIAEGKTTVHGFLEGEDCLRTLTAFRQMGVTIEGPEHGNVIIHGVGKQGLKKPESVIDCGNSGTTIRLLSGLLAAQPFDSELTGDESLQKRPMERISKPLTTMHANIQTTDGKPPLHIKASQALKGITYEMPIASAQVKSCLLMAGMYAESETTVIEPEMTRDHTERMLESFSYPIKKQGNSITISSHASCKATEIQVPGDISSAAFFMVAASVIPGSKLSIRNVGVNPTRIGIIEILNRMGANIKLSNPRFYGKEPVADILISYAPLQGVDIPLELVPLAIDEFPILFIAAACAKGKTTVRGAKELRSKESDRLASMVVGLNKLGIDANALEDGAEIIGGVLQGGEVDSFHDHRIAMSFAIAGAIAKESVTIRDCDNVVTSFPSFIEKANQIHLSIHRYDYE